VPYLHQTDIAVSETQRQVNVAITVIVCKRLLLRDAQVRFEDNRRSAETGIALPQQHRRSASIARIGRDPILYTVAIQIRDIYIRAIAATEQDIKLCAVAADCQVFDSVSVEIAPAIRARSVPTVISRDGWNVPYCNRQDRAVLWQTITSFKSC
jgi:hypothetical protein